MISKEFGAVIFAFLFLAVLVGLFVPPHHKDSVMQPTLRLEQSVFADRVTPIKLSSSDIDIYWGHDFVYYLNFYNDHGGDEWQMDLVCEDKEKFVLTNETLYTEKKFVSTSENERFKFVISKEAFVNALNMSSNCTITFTAQEHDIMLSKNITLSVVRLQKDPSLVLTDTIGRVVAKFPENESNSTD